MDSWKTGDDNDNLIFEDLEVLTSDDDVDEILLVDINDCGIEMLWLNETVFIVLTKEQDMNYPVLFFSNIDGFRTEVRLLDWNTFRNFYHF